MTPVKGDFAKALAMIARLPLTDVEKADAVRRLLTTAEHAVIADQKSNLKSDSIPNEESP